VFDFSCPELYRNVVRVWWIEAKYMKQPGGGGVRLVLFVDTVYRYGIYVSKYVGLLNQ
jgi:hypothetical protein